MGWQAPKLTEKQLWERVERAQRRATLGTTAFPGDTPAKKAARLERVSADAVEFGLVYLPHYFTCSPATFHRPLGAALCAFAELDPEHARGLAVVTARGSAKTTIAMAAMLRMLVVDEVPFGIFVTRVLAQASEVVEAIADELEDNIRLKADFGELLKSRVATAWGSSVETEAGCRIQALGMRSSFRGLKHRQHRPWYGLVDDPEDDIDVRSPETRARTLDVITSKIRPALAPGGGLGLIQNIIQGGQCAAATVRSDVERAAEAEAEGLAVEEFRFRSWTVIEFDLVDPETGESCWPERFTTAQLREMEQEDPEGFAAEIKGQGVARGGRKFAAHLTRYYDEADVDDDELWKVLTVDPSLGKSDRSDFSALIGVGATPKSAAYVRHASIERRSPLAIVDDTLALYVGFRPDLVCFEKVGFQEVLADLFWAACEERGLAPNIALIDHGGVPKPLRIERLCAPHDRGTLRFLRAHQRLLRQLHDFPHAKHDDGPDALEIAWRKVTERRLASTGLEGVRLGGRRRLWARQRGAW